MPLSNSHRNNCGRIKECNLNKNARRSEEGKVTAEAMEATVEKDVLTRTSWADAKVGLALLKQVEAN